LSNLRSELPPLRVLSAAALVLLLEISHGKSKESISESVGGNSEDVKAMETPLSSTLLETDFGKVTLQNLSVDHHYADGQIRSGQGRFVGQFSEKKNSMVWVPRNLRSWPRTRTWDSTMKGDAFSPKSAKLFQLLVQECGMAAIEAFRSPLQMAVVEPEDRGLQCAVAEVIAGFLHADAMCVTDAWNEWLCSLVKNFLNQSSVESIPEWAACIRFIVTRKGRLGKKVPAMRSLIMSCLADRVAATASSNAIVKHFTFLWTAVAESPISDDEPHEAAFQQAILNEALCFVRHPAPQVYPICKLNEFCMRINRMINLN
jgi:proteasome activator subunit 4